MSNPYFTNPANLLPNQRARAGDVSGDFDLVVAGFDAVYIQMGTIAPAANLASAASVVQAAASATSASASATSAATAAATAAGHTASTTASALSAFNSATAAAASALVAANPTALALAAYLDAFLPATLPVTFSSIYTFGGWDFGTVAPASPFSNEVVIRRVNLSTDSATSFDYGTVH